MIEYMKKDPKEQSTYIDDSDHLVIIITDVVVLDYFLCWLAGNLFILLFQVLDQVDFKFKADTCRTSCIDFALFAGVFRRLGLILGRVSALRGPVA